jgi:hypothetical protein
MSRVVKRLVARGLVTHRVKPKNNREVRNALTEVAAWPMGQSWRSTQGQRDRDIAHHDREGAQQIAGRKYG